MTDKVAGVRQLATYKENPFLEAMGHVPQRKRSEILYDGKQAVIQRETGEVQEDQLSIARIKWVEAEQFVKVYTANVSVFFDLSKSAQRVCEYLVDSVSRSSVNGDRVILYFEDYKDFCDRRGGKGSSANTFNRGLRELADKALVARASRRDHWFINPAIMFNGDRARFITEVRKKKKSQAEIAEDNGQMSFISRDDGEK